MIYFEFSFKMEEHQNVTHVGEGSGESSVSMSDILSFMHSIRTELMELKQASSRFQAALPPDGVSNEILALRREIAELKASNGESPTAMYTSSMHTTKEPKIAMPEKFDGSRSKFRGFIMQVQLFLHMHPSRYADGATQIGFVGTLLTGSALSWFAPLLEKNSPLLRDWEAFLETFSAAFGDSDRERVAETKMQNLRQGTRSASIYAAEFRQLTCDLDWNDKAFINRFRFGLKDDVKDLLLTMPRTENLEEFMSQAITCDNRLFERRQETKSTWSQSYQSANYSYTKPIKSSSSSAEPMQIDATHVRRLTQAEKDYRMKHDLCRYCGNEEIKEKHFARDCPLLPKNKIHKVRAVLKEGSDAEKSGNANVQLQ